MVNTLEQDLPREDVSPVHIMELKFQNHMPLLFKELLTEFAIPAGGFSKYRRAIDVFDLAQIHRNTSSSLNSSKPSSESGEVRNAVAEATALVDCATSEERLLNA